MPDPYYSALGLSDRDVIDAFTKMKDQYPQQSWLGLWQPPAVTQTVAAPQTNVGTTETTGTPSLDQGGGGSPLGDFYGFAPGQRPAGLGETLGQMAASTVTPTTPAPEVVPGNAGMSALAGTGIIDPYLLNLIKLRQLKPSMEIV